MSWKRLLPPVVLLLVWQGLSASGVIPEYKLPSPVAVAAGLLDLIRT